MMSYSADRGSMDTGIADVPSVSGIAQAIEHLYPLGRMAIVKLFNAPAEAVPRFELAEMNLIAAYGLPGTEGMDMGAMLATLDTWAKRIADHTLKSIHVFHKYRSDYGTLAQFRITAMLQALTREFGVRYNPDRIADPHVWTNPEDSFIHGVLGLRRAGTCSSLPVLLTALGRRMGYPLKLVLAPGHVFCRWDTPGERFNVEYNERGLNSHPDEHYREWPVSWTPELHERERKCPEYLVSLTPQQELALFATLRSHSLDAAGRRQEAAAAMKVAFRYWPRHCHGVMVNHLMTKALFPDRRFPNQPCEETAGAAAAIQRIVAELKRIEVDRFDRCFERLVITT
jgi:hypothetical protein